MIKPKESSSGVSIELTPIIDMVFLLLVFFLVATTFHQTEREMQIALPEAQSAGPITTALREIIVNVDAEGKIIVNGKAMELVDLRTLIEGAVANNPDQKATVRGDRTTPYANIVRVLDVLKGGGIQEPFLDTIPGVLEG